MAYNGKIEISTNKGKVYFTREDGKGWVYDINLGVLLGLRNNPIIRFPFSLGTTVVTTKDDFSLLFWEKVSIYGYSINKNFIKSIADLEMIYNIVKDRKLVNDIYHETRRFCNDKKEKLEYIQYCKKNGYIDYRTWHLNCLKIKYKTIFEKYKDLPHYSEYTIRELFNFPELAPYYDDILKHCFLNGMRSLDFCGDYTFFRIFQDIVKEMEKYDIPYEYNRNFPLWYSQMKDTIAVRKNLELSIKFSKVRQNMPNLHYSNEKYEAIIPNSIEEYCTEARTMNNCIERSYLELVANEKTYIVFIRDKADINAPLVDCEISPNGIIKQFLKKNNYRASDEDLINFRREYQNYLLNNIFNK